MEWAELKMRKPLSTWAGNFLGLASLLVALGPVAAAHAQEQNPAVPYASIASKGTSYAGPGRAASYDLAGPVIHIGILAPLQGAQKPDGEAIIRAAQLALEDASSRPLPGGLRLALAVGDESGPAWGRVSDAILHLVMDEQAIAIVTSANGATAHLSEQVGNRMGVPILTLSTDATTTQIDLPWIIRLGPSDVVQAQAIAQSIYQANGFRSVLLVIENDHDGRVGGREFLEAARRLGVPAPVRLVSNPLQPDVRLLLARVKTESPQAIVLWTRSDNAKILLQAIRQAGTPIPVYLSQEAAQEGSGVAFPLETSAPEDLSSAGTFTVASRQAGTPSREAFVRRYRLATGKLPGPVAAEAYDAVRLIERAVREAGPNRARVRDRISRVRDSEGVSGRISFDEEGNNRTNVRLVRLRGD
jgi:branched-chain amino acid transport system substrate-binding protein